MPRCTRRGCGQEYEPSHNTDESCTYHSGGPIFHEGLKSWSCCSDVNKPVLDFDEFMKIPGCAKGAHTDEAVQAEPPKPPPNANVRLTEVKSETVAPHPKPSGSQTFKSTMVPRAAEPVPLQEEEEDLTATVPVGTKCRHNGCQACFESDNTNRTGDGPGTVCTYHPMPPVFHEGSKGYLCCKRRVLEFDEFLKIQGCKTGRHVFVPKSKGDEAIEQLTECRIDHYQTPTEVHVSVFAKQADRERSSVQIESESVHLDIHLPLNKRFRKSIQLFGPVDPETSSYKYYGTKVELVLKKLDTRSWTLLEKTDKDLGGISLTFGVTGRTGTIGAKELILDESNKSRGS